MPDDASTGDEELAEATEGPVRILTFQRSARRNALSAPLMVRLEAALRAAQEADDIRAVVLWGVGGHFSSGGDATSILDAIDGPEGSIPHLMRRYQSVVKAIWSSPLPVIAAVDGVAFGGAFNLALACDLVLCTPTSRFCQVFSQRGLVPDMGGAFLLPRLVGMQRAKALMFFATEIGAQQALELGIVNELVADGEVRARAVELGCRLAALSSTAVSMTKQLLNASVGDLGNALEMEAVAQHIALSTPAAKSGFERFR